MTPEEARRAARRLQDGALIAEAESVAEGWHFLTVDGVTVEDQPSADLYEQVITVFRQVVGTGRQGRHFRTSSGLTFGIHSADAEERVQMLRERLDMLNPTGSAGERRWTLREGMR
ncbi:hypothetical protein [Streptomyces sp. NPDC059816]|uniref:hypothetical protein n=1 Tax=Streptomyces sp. NPDC059816 TaxID=3346960 RepID=UPI003660ACDA